MDGQQPQSLGTGSVDAVVTAYSDADAPWAAIGVPSSVPSAAVTLASSQLLPPLILAPTSPEEYALPPGLTQPQHLGLQRLPAPQLPHVLGALPLDLSVAAVAAAPAAALDAAMTAVYSPPELLLPPQRLGDAQGPWGRSPLPRQGPRGAAAGPSLGAAAACVAGATVAAVTAGPQNYRAADAAAAGNTPESMEDQTLMWTAPGGWAAAAAAAAAPEVASAAAAGAVAAAGCGDGDAAEEGAQARGRRCDSRRKAQDASVSGGGGTGRGGGGGGGGGGGAGCQLFPSPAVDSATTACGIPATGGAPPLAPPSLSIACATCSAPYVRHGQRGASGFFARGTGAFTCHGCCLRNSYHCGFYGPPGTRSLEAAGGRECADCGTESTSQWRTYSAHVGLYFCVSCKNKRLGEVRRSGAKGPEEEEGSGTGSGRHSSPQLGLPTGRSAADGSEQLPAATTPTHNIDGCSRQPAASPRLLQVPLSPLSLPLPGDGKPGAFPGVVTGVLADAAASGTPPLAAAAGSTRSPLDGLAEQRPVSPGAVHCAHCGASHQRPPGAPLGCFASDTGAFTCHSCCRKNSAAHGFYGPTGTQSMEEAGGRECVECGTEQTSRWHVSQMHPGSYCCNACGMSQKRLDNAGGAPELQCAEQGGSGSDKQQPLQPQQQHQPQQPQPQQPQQQQRQVVAGSRDTGSQSAVSMQAPTHLTPAAAAPLALQAGAAPTASEQQLLAAEEQPGECVGKDQDRGADSGLGQGLGKRAGAMAGGPAASMESGGSADRGEGLNAVAASAAPAAEVAAAAALAATHAPGAVGLQPPPQLQQPVAGGGGAEAAAARQLGDTAAAGQPQPQSRTELAAADTGAHQPPRRGAAAAATATALVPLLPRVKSLKSTRLAAAVPRALVSSSSSSSSSSSRCGGARRDGSPPGAGDAAAAAAAATAAAVPPPPQPLPAPPLPLPPPPPPPHAGSYSEPTGAQGGSTSQRRSQRLAGAAGGAAASACSSGGHREPGDEAASRQERQQRRAEEGGITAAAPAAVGADEEEPAPAMEAKVEASAETAKLELQEKLLAVRADGDVRAIVGAEERAVVEGGAGMNVSPAAQEQGPAGAQEPVTMAAQAAVAAASVAAGAEAAEARPGAQASEAQAGLLHSATAMAQAPVMAAAVPDAGVALLGEAEAVPNASAQACVGPSAAGIDPSTVRCVSCSAPYELVTRKGGFFAHGTGAYTCHRCCHGNWRAHSFYGPLGTRSLKEAGGRQCAACGTEASPSWRPHPLRLGAYACRPCESLLRTEMERARQRRLAVQEGREPSDDTAGIRADGSPPPAGPPAPSLRAPTVAFITGGAGVAAAAAAVVAAADGVLGVGADADAGAGAAAAPVPQAGASDAGLPRAAVWLAAPPVRAAARTAHHRIHKQLQKPQAAPGKASRLDVVAAVAGGLHGAAAAVVTAAAAAAVQQACTADSAGPVEPEADAEAE